MVEYIQNMYSNYSLIFFSRVLQEQDFPVTFACVTGF